MCYCSGGINAPFLYNALRRCVSPAPLHARRVPSHAPHPPTPQGLGFVVGLMPALQLYAAAFFAVPAIR